MSCTIAAGNTLDCKNNKGGVKVIYVAPWAAGAYSPTIVANVITVWAGAAGPAVFYKFEVRSQKAVLGETIKMNKDNGTQFFEQTGSFNVEKMTAAKTAQLATLLQNRCLVIGTDNNGKLFLHGYNNGVDFGDAVGTTGTKMEDMNGYSLSWLGTEESQALEVTSSLIATIVN